MPEEPKKSVKVVVRKTRIPIGQDPKSTRKIVSIFSTLTDLIREQRAKLRPMKKVDVKSFLIVQLFKVNPELREFLAQLEEEDKESYANLVAAIDVRIDEEIGKI